MHPELAEYFSYMEQIGKPKAARAYRYAIAGFETWLNKQYRDFSSFTVNDVTMYMSGMDKPKTANLFRTALITYLKYRAGSMMVGDPAYMNEVQRMSQLRMVQPRKQTREFEKIALTITEVKSLLDKLKKNFDTFSYSLGVLYAYFGARPGEFEGFFADGKFHSLKTAKINWKNRSMVIITEKTWNKRLLVWHPKITPYIENVIAGLPCPYPARNFSMKMYRFQSGNKNLIGGIRVTAKTLRRTVQTNQRLLGSPDVAIDHVLGHVSKSSSMGDIYTDQTMLEPVLREMMEKNHYMIVGGVI